MFDKLKSIFYDEIEVEDTNNELEKVDRAVKKEIDVVKPKIEKVDFSSLEENVKEEKEPIKEENTFTDRELFRSERTFNFTEFDEPEETLPPRKNILDIEKNRNSRVNDVKPQVTEPKVFKPSPVISPIYGILNKDYKKEEIKEKPAVNTELSSVKVTSYDTVRRKAYGTLEDDLEDTLNKVNKMTTNEINEKMYQEEDTYQEEVYQTKKSKIEDLISKIEEVDEEIDKSMTIGDLEEKEIDATFDEDKTMTDSHLEHDLFNLIDSMYDDKED